MAHVTPPDAITTPAPASAPPAQAAGTSPDHPWPLRLVAEKIEGYISRLTPLWIEAQVVQVNRRSGTSFLTLRDVHSEVSMSAVVYRRYLAACERNLRGPLRDGLRVVVHARPAYWTSRGSLQLDVREMRLVGSGDLLAAVDQLRRTLAAQGLFAPERKRPLPFLPRTVGLVCGRDAKAKDDVITNARLRWPGLPFEVREVAVQGVHAVAQVSAAIAELDQIPHVDVIVVARGGGSVEDLLPFSDEGLVLAASRCRTPLVSAIGHETDNPILDDVADYRASTPTDAARRIVPDLAQETEGIAQARHRMRAHLAQRLEHEADALARTRARPVLATPTVLIDSHQADLGAVRQRLNQATRSALALATSELRAERARLDALSPRGVMERGYAVLRTPGGQVVTSSEQISKGDLLEAILASGRLVAQVVGATRPSHDQGLG